MYRLSFYSCAADLTRFQCFSGHIAASYGIILNSETCPLSVFSISFWVEFTVAISRGTSLVYTDELFIVAAFILHHSSVQQPIVVIASRN